MNTSGADPNAKDNLGLTAMQVGTPAAAKAQAAVPLNGVLKGRRGFFRVAWKPADHPDAFALLGSRTLRCAIIDEYPAAQNADSPFGMNSAYPWPILHQLAKKGGLTWMRDWSPSWDIIEHEPGKVDFAVPDRQIGAILAEKLNVLPLLVSPSAQWSSAADLQKVDNEIARTGRKWARVPMICSWLPKDLAGFGNYVTRTVEHYRKHARYFEVINEPICQDWSGKFSYNVADYIGLLKVAYEACKAEDKDSGLEERVLRGCRGGQSCRPETSAWSVGGGSDGQQAGGPTYT